MCVRDGFCLCNGDGFGAVRAIGAVAIAIFIFHPFKVSVEELILPVFVEIPLSVGP